MRQLAFVAAIVTAGALALGHAQDAAPGRSGIDRRNFDTAVRPQDDFFRYVNGGWMARTEIPSDHTSTGSFVDLRDEAERHVRGLIEALAQAKDKKAGSAAQQIGDLYVSYMDEARADGLGALPLKPELAKIDAITTKTDLAVCLGQLSMLGIGGLGLDVTPDARRPSETTLAMGQGGITLLPDRDYYLKDDPKLADIRTKYQAYLAKIFTLLGRADPAADASAVVALETEVAKAQLPAAELRDPVKRYNPYTLAKLTAEMPGFDWAAWARAQESRMSRPSSWASLRSSRRTRRSPTECRCPPGRRG